MDYVVALGAGALGFVVGALIGFLIDDQERMTIRIVYGSISLIVGAAVMAFFKYLSPEHVLFREYWLYPVGAAVGLVFALLFNRIAYPDEKIPK